MHGVDIVALFAIAVIFSPLYLRTLTHFIIELRRAGRGGKELQELRQELLELRREYQQSKGDQNDAILGLNKALSRLEERFDRQAGIDTPPPAPEAGTAPPPLRQL